MGIDWWCSKEDGINDGKYILKVLLRNMLYVCCLCNVKIINNLYYS